MPLDDLLSELVSNSHVKLQSHPNARAQACAAEFGTAGKSVVVVEALMTALLPSEKGRRCDACLHAPSADERLFKCSGCASFWYCGKTCQQMQWQSHHRKICKKYSQFITSPGYQYLSETERIAALMLSQLLVAVFPEDNFKIPPSNASRPVAIFFDLMKGPGLLPHNFPLCRASRPPSEVIEEIYRRFGNNNFLIHSHLTSCAHGIFPLASRLFNHSCVPNCVAKYRFAPNMPVKLEIVALRDLAPGEEITIPYLDPALPFETRQDVLRVNYGFTCSCSLCAFQREISPLPPLPQDAGRISCLETQLCNYVTNSILAPKPHILAFVTPSVCDKIQRCIPEELRPLLNSTYLPSLAEEFSRASHEGEADKALSSGRSLFSLYMVLYPSSYPQIGMHALELTKTAWNAFVTHDESHDTSSSAIAVRYLDTARHYLDIAAVVLDILGPEGDEGGPLEELNVMRTLLHGSSVSVRADQP